MIQVGRSVSIAYMDAPCPPEDQLAPGEVVNIKFGYRIVARCVVVSTNDRRALAYIEEVL